MQGCSVHAMQDPSQYERFICSACGSKPAMIMQPAQCFSLVAGQSSQTVSSRGGLPSRDNRGQNSDSVPLGGFKETGT